MTKNFDTLLEQMLSEMTPADIGEIGFGGAAERIKAGVPEGEPKGHFAPLQKLSSEDREKVINEILKEVFSEKENTYAPTVDSPEELHSTIQAAIKNVSSKTSLKASAEYASKFLADRLMTLLKGHVKYTTAGGEELEKDMTQKEFKQALNKALEKPSEEAEESSKEDSEEESDETEKVYIKAADLDSDDSDLQKAFNKLPDNEEMSWEKVVKAITTSKALALLDAGGLSEVEVEKEEKEDDEVQALDFDEEDDVDLSKFDRIIDPYFRTTKGSYELPD